MSKAFPTDKDHIIDMLDDDHKLSLSEEEYERLRRLTVGELLLLTSLFLRAEKAQKEKDQ